MGAGGAERRQQEGAEERTGTHKYLSKHRFARMDAQGHATCQRPSRENSVVRPLSSYVEEWGGLPCLACRTAERGAGGQRGGRGARRPTCRIGASVRCWKRPPGRGSLASAGPDPWAILSPVVQERSPGSSRGGVRPLVDERFQCSSPPAVARPRPQRGHCAWHLNCPRGGDGAVPRPSRLPR